MKCVESIAGGHCRVNISGSLTFEDYKEFKQFGDSFVSRGIKLITLDFSRLDHIDTSSLGMLLLLKDNMDESNVGITISGVNGQPGQMMRVCNMDKVFDVDFSTPDSGTFPIH